MGAKVELTWVFKGRVRSEVCELADYDATLKTFDGEPVPEELSENIKKQGFVMFEDEEGAFCVHHAQIRNIRFL